MSQHTALLLLGSNLGNAEANINTGLILLEVDGNHIIRRSEMVTTEPVEFHSNNNFCNIAAELRTSFSPVRLLNLIKEIEKKMGRFMDSSVTGSYTDRIIDIDIVKFDNVIFQSKKLTIPHEKHLFQRAFSKALINTLKNK